MARQKRELTPRPQNQCWRKYYKGKYHYVGKGAVNGKGNNPWENANYTGTNTSCPAYQTALAEWYQLRAKIDADELAQRQKEIRLQAVADADENPSLASALHLNSLLADHGGVPKGEHGGEQPTVGVTVEQLQTMILQTVQQAMKQQTGPAPAEPAPAPESAPVASMATSYAGTAPLVNPTSGGGTGKKSITGLAADFMEQQSARVELGEIKPRMLAEYKAKIDDFVGWIADQNAKRQKWNHDNAELPPLPMLSEIDQVNTELLGEYKKLQLKLIQKEKSEGGTSASTAKKRLRAVKVFFEWCFVNENLDVLPRILMNKFDNVPMPKPNPEFYTVAEVRELYKAAPPLLRACILLASNCGYYQNDIGSLTWEMIDAKTGIVSRQRGKTGVPMQHRLWNCTLEALQELSKSKTGVVLTWDDGTPLFSETVGDDGKCKIKDRIASMYRTLQKKLGQKINGKGFSTLRNTAANLVEQYLTDKPWVSEQFLGHSTAGMKSHYVAPNFVDCLDACEWLDTQFQLCDCEPDE